MQEERGGGAGVNRRWKVKKRGGGGIPQLQEERRGIVREGRFRRGRDFTVAGKKEEGE